MGTNKDIYWSPFPGMALGRNQYHLELEANEVGDHFGSWAQTVCYVGVIKWHAIVN